MFGGPDVFKEVPSSWKWGPLLSNVLLTAVVGTVNQASTVEERGGFKLLKRRFRPIRLVIILFTDVRRTSALTEERRCWHPAPRGGK